MADIRPGMIVRLVKAPAIWEPLPFDQIFTETGLVIGTEQSTETHFEKLYRVRFSSGEYWLGADNIQAIGPCIESLEELK